MLCVNLHIYHLFGMIFNTLKRGLDKRFTIQDGDIPTCVVRKEPAISPIYRSLGANGKILQTRKVVNSCLAVIQMSKKKMPTHIQER